MAAERRRVRNVNRPDREPTLVVREAWREDRDFVRELGLTCLGHHGPEVGRWLETWFDSQAVGTLIAAHGKDRLGWCMLGFALSADASTLAGDLIAIAVVPAARRRGIARLLVDEVISLAGSAMAPAGRRLLQLQVAERNMAGRALFEAAGFVEVPEEKGAYPSGEVALRMRRDVAAR